MKNNLLEKEKIKSSLLNHLKLNRKSIEILDPTIFSRFNQLKSNTTRISNIKKNNFQKKYNIKLNLFPKKDTSSKKVKKSLITLQNKNIIDKSKILPLLSEQSSDKSKNEPEKNIKIKLSLNSNKKNKNSKANNIDETITSSHFMTLNLTSNRECKKNLEKYRQIFNSVSSRIKTNYKKKKSSPINHNRPKNFSSQNVKLLNALTSPKKKKNSLRISNQPLLYLNSPKKQRTLEDYNKTLKREFNTQELINIENGKIKQRLKEFKVKVYGKSPLFDTTEKLNVYLGREFNLDIRNLKRSFNKKYNVYVNSLNKIREIKHRNLFGNNNVFGFRISLNQNLDESNDDLYNYKTQYSDIETKNSLKDYYKFKSKDLLEKKLDLEKQLVELENKFSYIIEQEKSEKNRYGINYGEINQVVEKKFLVREIYELDRNKKKKEFYDEQTKILYQTRKYLPNKVLKEILKQKTINKFKDITGVNFA